MAVSFCCCCCCCCNYCCDAVFVVSKTIHRSCNNTICLVLVVLLTKLVRGRGTDDVRSNRKRLPKLHKKTPKHGEEDGKTQKAGGTTTHPEKRGPVARLPQKTIEFVVLSQTYKSYLWRSRQRVEKGGYSPLQNPRPDFRGPLGKTTNKRPPPNQSKAMQHKLPTQRVALILCVLRLMLSFLQQDRPPEASSLKR